MVSGQGGIEHGVGHILRRVSAKIVAKCFKVNASGNMLNDQMVPKDSSDSPYVRRQHQPHDHQETTTQAKAFLPGPHPTFHQTAATLLDRGIILAPQREHGQPHGGQGDYHQDDGNYITHGVLYADGSDAQVSLGCQHVVDVQQQRCAEVVKNFQENERCACDIPGHGQRQHDSPEQPQPRATQVLGRLFHGAVDILKGR